MMAGRRKRRAATRAARAVSAERVVYGARCSWWGSITDVATKPSGLPCCPHCGGVLMEVDNEGVWWTGARRYEADGHPGYVDFLTWLRGRCFPSLEHARTVYDGPRGA